VAARWVTPRRGPPSAIGTLAVMQGSAPRFGITGGQWIEACADLPVASASAEAQQ